MESLKNEISAVRKALFAPKYDVEHSPSSWIMPNRVGFSDFVDKTFRYSDERPAGASGSDGRSLMNHQKIIKDFMQYDSPYRGILLFHGLGVGKSCAAIASAEILMQHMDICVLLQASLEDNFKREIMQCGMKFLNTQVVDWEFREVPRAEAGAVGNLYRVDPALVLQLGGVWVPKARSAGQKKTQQQQQQQLSESEAQSLRAMKNSIVKNRYSFLRYNGLTLERVQAMYAAQGNLFDDKVVVIDEVHNFTSSASKDAGVRSVLYDMLLAARGCKVILLSGTPIVNQPHEIALVVNLLHGQLREYRMEFDGIVDRGLVRRLETKYPQIDRADADSNALSLTLLPEGFAYSNRDAGEVRRVEKWRAENLIDDMKNWFLLADADAPRLRDARSSLTHALPPTKPEFDRLFVDEQTAAVKNRELLSRRMQGTVSAFSVYDENYPTKSVALHALPMGTLQFEYYARVRKEERKRELAVDQENSVYKFYSRAACNFALPDGLDGQGGAEAASSSSDFSRRVHQADPAEALRKLEAFFAARVRRGSAASGEQAVASAVRDYSPKYAAILASLGEEPGTSMIYSQFRALEGIGILEMLMKLAGWEELRVKKREDAGGWELDGPRTDRPKYIVFDSNGEDGKIKLDIFNSVNVPSKIGKTNLRGEIVKAIMITQSGSEGISLRNVRNVHIIEPYWNYVRIDQVIGRAVRAHSHADLDEHERRVDVKIYVMQLDEDQKDRFKNGDAVADGGLTTDEYIFALADRKQKVIDEIYRVLKSISIDCKGDSCFKLPTADSRALDYINTVSAEEEAAANTTSVLKWKGRLIKSATFDKIFLVKDDAEVYDYGVYLDTGRLVKLGTFEQRGDSFKIVLS